MSTETLADGYYWVKWDSKRKTEWEVGHLFTDAADGYKQWDAFWCEDAERPEEIGERIPEPPK